MCLFYDDCVWHIEKKIPAICRDLYFDFTTLRDNKTDPASFFKVEIKEKIKPVVKCRLHESNINIQMNAKKDFLKK